MRYFVSILVAVAILWTILSLMISPSVHTPPGVLVVNEPIQEKIPPLDLPGMHGYTIKAVANYTIRGRVLCTKHYWADGNDLVPFDVALGWGRMSDQSIIDRLGLSQGNRFFFYAYDSQAPIPDKEIDRHSSNNHLIAATSAIKRVIAGLYPGEIVTMKGYLVNAGKPDGMRWDTSLSREDSGAGACEVMYVQGIKVEQPGAPIPATPAPTTPAPAPKSA